MGDVKGDDFGLCKSYGILENIMMGKRRESDCWTRKGVLSYCFQYLVEKQSCRGAYECTFRGAGRPPSMIWRDEECSYIYY